MERKSSVCFMTSFDIFMQVCVATLSLLILVYRSRILLLNNTKTNWKDAINIYTILLPFEIILNIFF